MSTDPARALYIYVTISADDNERRKEMAVRRKSSNKKTEDKKFMIVNDFSILRTHEFDNGNISFDLKINGITLYRLSVVSVKDSDRVFIGFPSYQAKDGKWYNYYYLPLSDEDMDKIINAVYDNLND